ncbi:MAG: acetate--CoA ligase [bacterium]|nr:acetate--CoA ligase [bacterium]
MEIKKDKPIYEKASKDPIGFWEDLASEISWQKKWGKAFVHEPPYFKWFIGGKLNITESCLDRHLKDKGDKTALIWEPEPLEEKLKLITYGQLFAEVCKFANALKKLGVKKGDRVAIYMPMIPETVVSMLACARIGAVHSVVFSAFSPTALQARIQDTGAKILITADGYYRRGQVINLKAAADQGVGETSVEKVILVKRAGNEISWQENRDFWWHELITKEKPECSPETMDSEDPFFILYTSGSTGQPKGILHTCGGYAVQAQATGKWIFDFKDDDIFWCTADIGWVTGHTYGVYSPLLNGIATLMFEGAPDWPAPDRWAKTIEKHKITIFYTAPTAIRMFQKYGEAEIKEENLSSLRLLGSVGEPIDEAAWLWYFENVGKSKCEIVDTWWQTETGGILISSLPGIGPFKPAFAGLPFPGVKADILDEQGQSCPAGKSGNLVILPPFPPGMLRGIYNNDEKYRQTYWSQYGGKTYFTSDAAFKNKEGLVRILGRVDDVLKVAGHRISTGELENAVNKHEFLGETAVVGVPDEIKGEAIVVFAVREKGPFFSTSDTQGKLNPNENELKQAVIDQIKKEIGPIALPKQIYIVEDLPKTRSGKIMRRILKKLLIGEELGDLSTLANPEIVEKIKAQVKPN